MSIIDTRTLPEAHQIESDLCIIGSGAAGLAIAHEFMGSSQRVAVLESGGRSFDPNTQSLYLGQSVGLPHAPLDQARLRYLGGTTNHWTAHLRPLDPLDFESRSWVPHSGWPFDRSTLDPYYERVRAFLYLPERPFDVAAWRIPQREPWTFEDDHVTSEIRQILPESERRLGPILEPKLAASKNVEVYLHANVTAIELDETRKRVERLEIRTLEGKRLTARGRHAILAAGGIENARILLLSEVGTHADRQKNLVGRFYANHPEAPVGEYLSSGVAVGFYTFRRQSGRILNGALKLSAATQRQSRLRNCSLTLRPRLRRVGSNALGAPARLVATLADAPSRERTRLAFEQEVADLARSMDRLAMRDFDLDVAHAATPAPTVEVIAIAEQSPNPESRVRLGDEKDRLGQRRVVLDWQIEEIDSESVAETTAIIAREIGAAGLGRVRLTFPPRDFEHSTPRDPTITWGPRECTGIPTRESSTRTAGCTASRTSTSPEARSFRATEPQIPPTRFWLWPSA